MCKRLTLTSVLATLLLGVGCISHPKLLSLDNRKPIDRRLVEYPAGFTLKTIATGITDGCAIAFVHEEGAYDRALLVAERGLGDNPPRIYGWKADGTFFNVYPHGQQIPLVDMLSKGQIYGPIGGMVVSRGRIYVTHRDKNGRGIVSSLGFDGSVNTVVADLPTQGDYSLTDVAAHPTNGKLYFGIGAATNSGVVGSDNWEWVKLYPDFCDLPYTNIKLLGYKFLAHNPNAGLFGGDDNVSTAPFHPFSKNSQLRIGAAPNGRPTSAIYTISATGGDLHVWAHGIRLPRGLAFDEFGNLFATNNGMELRGTRPVKDDPDALLKVLPDTWYGWPDYSADLLPVSEPKFTEPGLISKSGYPELSSLIDQAASGLTKPEPYRGTLLYSDKMFLPLSGTAKMDFVPASSSLREFRGNALIAMDGDRAPLATSGQKLMVQPGRKVVRTNLDTKHTEDFIRNTQGIPASQIGRDVDALERPIDVKFGPDGNIYILDRGQMDIREGRERAVSGTGRIYIMEPTDRATTVASK